MQLTPFGLRATLVRGCLGALLIILSAIAGNRPARAAARVFLSRPATSKDAATTITYTCDDGPIYSWLNITPAADHKPGEMIEIKTKGRDGKVCVGKIPQVAPHL